MSAGFTPGPWELDGNSDIRVAGGNYVASAMREEDCRLVAAAPDLYEALEAIDRIVLEQRCERGTPWDLACTTIAAKVREYAEPILAKARGEQVHSDPLPKEVGR